MYTLRHDSHERVILLIATSKDNQLTLGGRIIIHSLLAWPATWIGATT
jgi:hypothetical protein